MVQLIRARLAGLRMLRHNVPPLPRVGHAILAHIVLITIMLLSMLFPFLSLSEVGFAYGLSEAGFAHVPAPNYYTCWLYVVLGVSPNHDIRRNFTLPIRLVVAPLRMRASHPPSGFALN